MSSQSALSLIGPLRDDYRAWLLEYVCSYQPHLWPHSFIRKSNLSRAHQAKYIYSSTLAHPANFHALLTELYTICGAVWLACNGSDTWAADSCFEASCLRVPSRTFHRLCGSLPPSWSRWFCLGCGNVEMPRCATGLWYFLAYLLGLQGASLKVDVMYDPRGKQWSGETGWEVSSSGQNEFRFFEILPYQLLVISYRSHILQTSKTLTWQTGFGEMTQSDR